jgi:hypothetical protein
MDALGVFGDLHGTLDDETASEMLRGIEASRRSEAMKKKIAPIPTFRSNPRF